MTTITLKRSGGLLGKTLQSTGEVDMDADEIIEQVKQLAPVDNPMARDDLYYSIKINGKKTFPVDVAMLKGKLKKIVAQLEEKLSAKDDA